jgi:3-(3-hydroxy-phenyl)propionate hydroxylase
VSTETQASESRERWPVIVVGAGPVGLCAAIDLAQRDIPVLVLEQGEALSVGSRAICWSQRTLQILDRLGCAQRVIEQGVSWRVGRVFFGEDEIYAFDLQAEPGHCHPPFINLQQYRVERLLVERLSELPAARLLRRHKLIGLASTDETRVTLRVDTPAGAREFEAGWLIAADGSRSPVRGMMGLDSEGQVFRERFLITDVRMRSAFPAERWFWFDPPFHRHQSALLHRQADDVWRIDLQLGPDADPELERRPERIMPRLRAMLGADARFDIEWASVYSFHCRRMRSFRHGRVLFVGDAAHRVSPFGARGANSGIQDVDNLVWKLERVLAGTSRDALLDTYDSERGLAADENIRHSTRSTDFITPKSAVSRIFRDAVLTLARRHPFARRMVNSGRLSQPCVCAASPLNTPDEDDFSGSLKLGSAAMDAPVAGPAGEWLLRHLQHGFTVVSFADVSVAARAALAAGSPSCRVIGVGGVADPGDKSEGTHARMIDAHGLLTQRYDAAPGSTFLFRPDQHLCARWRSFDAGRILAAASRAAMSPSLSHPVPAPALAAS